MGVSINLRMEKSFNMLWLSKAPGIAHYGHYCSMLKGGSEVSTIADIYLPAFASFYCAIGSCNPFWVH